MDEFVSSHSGINNSIKNIEDNDGNEIENNTNVWVLGVSGTIGAGTNLSGGVQLVIDSNGNIGIQIVGGAGGEAGASGNGSIYAGMYRAPSIYSLEGFGIEEGGTGGEVLIVGGGLGKHVMIMGIHYIMVDMEA